MILRIICMFFVMVFSAETLPFSNMNLRPASVSQADGNHPGQHSVFYPFLRLPVQRSPQMFSGHLNSPIRQPTLQFSAMLNGSKKKFNSFIPLRSTIPSSVFFDQYLSNIHQQTAQKVKQFGHRVIDTVQHHRKYHTERMHNVKEMLDHFRLDDVKNRLKPVFLKKKALMNKLHGKYVGIPYYTMNDDHMIVKKPGANFSLLSQPNIGISILAPVPAIHSIVTQHPGVPEVTTSVDLHQESDVPATIAGYMFPVTSIGTYTPEVAETTEITNSIGQDKVTSDTLNRTYTTVTTMTSMDYTTESTILEEDTAKTSFIKENESVAEVVVETIFTAVDVLSGMHNGDFGSVTVIDRDVSTEIGSTLFYSSTTETTWQMETTELPASQTTTLIDLLSRNKVKPITSSVIDVESTTTRIDSTLSTNIMIVDDRFASSIIDTETTIDAIISTVPFTISTEITSGIEGTSFQPPALDTTTVANETFGVMDTAFTSSAIDPESTSETISTASSVISTERPVVTDVISTTINTAIDSLMTDRKMTTEIASTLPSTISTEKTPWPLSAFETTPLVDVLSGFGYNNFPNVADEVEITTEVDATFLFITQAGTTTILPKRLTTSDSAYNNLTTESEGILEIVSTFPSALYTEATTTLEEISATPDSIYISLASDAETTTEIFSTLPSALSTKISPWPSLASEITSPANVSSTFGYSRFPSSTDQVKTTTEVVSTLFPTNSTETDMMVTERSKTVNPAFDASIIEIKRSTEIFPTFPSMVSAETNTILEEKSTSTDSLLGSSNTYDETTEDIVSTFSSTVSTAATITPVFETVALLDVLPKFEYYSYTDSTNAPETSTGVNSTLLYTIPTHRGTTTMLIERLTTVGLAFDIPTIEMEMTTGTVLALPSTISTSPPTISDEISTTTDPASIASTNDGDMTSKIVSTPPSTIFSKTTSWPVPVWEITPLPNVLSGFVYNRFPSFTEAVEKTIGVDATFPSTIPTETITTLKEISVTPDSAYINPASDAETMTEVVSILPSTLLPEITSRPSPALEITSLADVSSTFGYSRFPSSTDQVKTTTEVVSTLSPTNSTEINMMVTERPKTVDPAFDASTIEIESITETFSTFSFTASAEAATILEEKSMSTDSLFGSSTTYDESTADILSKFSSTVPTEASTARIVETAVRLDALPTFEYYPFTGSTNEPKTSTGVNSILVYTIPTHRETTTMLIERLTTDDLAFDSSTIQMEITTENILGLPSTISTSTPTISNEISTSIDSVFINSLSDGDATTKIVSMLPNTILTETTSWPVPAWEITPLPDILSGLSGYNDIPSSTGAVEKTTEVDGTFPYAIQAKTTTMMTETLTTVDPAFNYSTIDTERITEIVPMFLSAISTNTTTTSEEISASTPLDSSSIDEGTTVEIISIFSSTFPNKITTTPVSEITTLLNVLPRVGYNHFIGSTIAPETTTGVDSIFSSTIPTETTRIVTERLTTSAFENPTIDTGMTTEIDSTFPSTFTTKPTTTLEEISITTGLSLDSSTIAEGTTVQLISTFHSTVPTMSVEEISKATNLASNSFTDLGETTTEIVSTLPTTVSTEITTMFNHKRDSTAERSFVYFEENQVEGDKRNSDPVVPRFIHTSEEKPDVKSLLILIPLIIEELRQGNITPEEEHMLSQVFADLWPLLKEESKRKQGELMNHELAIFLFEAGQ